VFTPDGRYLVIWETSSIYHERRAAGWRGDVLLSDTAGKVIWEHAIDAETTGKRASLEAVRASGGWYTKPCITLDGEKIALAFDGTVVLLRTNDGDALAVLPINGTAHAVAINPVTDTLLLATDKGLRETKANANLGRAPRRLTDS
jgi:hypothetical protein